VAPQQHHRGVKCLVFAHHRRVLNVLEEGVEGGLGPQGYIRIDGNTPAAQRQPLVDR
jgi:SNF2 family DNA or RNA helicase